MPCAPPEKQASEGYSSQRRHSFRANAFGFSIRLFSIRSIIFDSINEHFEEHFSCANTNAERLASQTLEPDTSTFVVCMNTWRRSISR
jgi:hypothetical protein